MRRQLKRRAGGVSPLLGPNNPTHRTAASRELTYVLGLSNRTHGVAAGPNNPAHRTAQRDGGLTPPARLSAFTLTELLVVMVIMTLLVTMTVAAVNFSMASERSRAAARQVQSYLEGARDRAIYESAIRRSDYPVGVRFLLDPNIPDSAGNLIAVSSMVFIEEVSPAPDGTANVVHIDPNGTPGDGDEYWRATRTSGELFWANLANQGLLAPGVRIRIGPPGEDFRYTIVPANFDPQNERVSFQPDFNGNPGDNRFQLILPPVVRPNQEPVLLPRGIVIDLDRSRIPDFWRPGGVYTNSLDVMFSPRGTVTGRVASSGLLHFYVAETADVDRVETARSGGSYPDNVNFPAEPQYIPSDTPYGSPDDPVGDRVLVTLFPQTGAISSHPVDPTDADSNGTADNPYRYAEIGEVAGE